ncbi:MAG: hypothetical protein ABI988_03345 [Nitrospirota bacterium]
METKDNLSPALFERFCQVLDHPTFRSMAPGKQLLYLQLLRWSQGNGKELVEASRLDMCAWTGLALETIKKYLPQLIEDGLLTRVRESTPINPAGYEVFWMAAPPPSHTDPTVIAYYVDQLTATELAEGKRIEVLLTREERRQIQSTVSESLRTLGIPWQYDLIKRLITWYHLTHSPYRDQLERDHPDWFTTP